MTERERETKLTIRDVPASLRDGMDLRAGNMGVSREKMLLELLKKEFQEEAEIMKEARRQATGS